MEYYIKKDIEEHMLYPTEIAMLFHIYSETGQPHKRLISRVLEIVCNNDPNYVQYYYCGKSLNKVYAAKYYHKAIVYIKENAKKLAENIYSITLGHNTFYFNTTQ